MTQIDFLVEGMSCEHCVKTVTAALESLDGVTRAQVTLNTKIAVVQFDESRTSVEKMFEVLREKNYTPKKKV